MTAVRAEWKQLLYRIVNVLPCIPVAFKFRTRRTGVEHSNFIAPRYTRPLYPRFLTEKMHIRACARLFTIRKYDRILFYTLCCTAYKALPFENTLDTRKVVIITTSVVCN